MEKVPDISLMDGPQTLFDVSRLSDAELMQQLADQAKELGIEINLNYSFAQATVCHRDRW
jgi:hypothetical protein